MWLHEETGLNLCNVAMGSQGNGLISRKLIHAVSYYLSSHDSSDILVGIMWSSPDRHDFFSDDPSVSLEGNCVEQWTENPTQVVPHGHKRNRGWVICNYGWNTQSSKLYYKNFYSKIGQMVYTLENMLRVQWFLKSVGVDYFMTTYTEEVLPRTMYEDVELRPLWNLLDVTKFLPIDGCYEWCRDNTDIHFRQHDKHPLTEHHELFVKKFLIPHLNHIKLL